MSSVVIVGASRGIGYALAEVWSKAENNTVIGLARNPEAAKTKFHEQYPDRKNVHFLKADLRDYKSLQAARDESSKLLNGKLDVFIANAAIADSQHYDIGDAVLRDVEKFDADMRATFDTNVMGTIHATALFGHMVVKGQAKKIAVIGSGAGDYSWVVKNGIAGQSPYSISKAAVNMVVAKFQAQYKEDGIVVTSISPGVVDTGYFQDHSNEPGFGGLWEKMKAAFPPGGTILSATQSAEMVTDVINSLTLEQHGGYMVSQFGTRDWL